MHCAPPCDIRDGRALHQLDWEARGWGAQPMQRCWVLLGLRKQLAAHQSAMDPCPSPEGAHPAGFLLEELGLHILLFPYYEFEK